MQALSYISKLVYYAFLYIYRPMNLTEYTYNFEYSALALKCVYTQNDSELSSVSIGAYVYNGT